MLVKLQTGFSLAKSVIEALKPPSFCKKINYKIFIKNLV